MSQYQGRIQGGWVGGLATPSLGSFKLEIKKGNKDITEAIVSPFGQVSHPLLHFKNPESATVKIPFGDTRRARLMQVSGNKMARFWCPRPLNTGSF